MALVNRLLIVLLLALPAFADGPWYCAADANGLGDGTEHSPWTWAEAEDATGSVSAGETLYARGDFGDIGISAGEIVGSDGSPILITSWPGFPNPTCTKMSSGGGGASLYITYQNWTISPPGSLTDDGLPAVNLHTVNDLTYDNCTITGNFNSNLTIVNSDFFPQFWGNDSAVSVQNTACQDIAFTDCDFSEGFRFISAANLSCSGWSATNCTFGTVSEDSVVLKGDNSSVTGCTFAGQNVNKGTYFWPSGAQTGTRMGDWTGQEYNPVFQGVTGATGLLASVTATKISLYPNRNATLPDKTTTYNWYLTSDPCNIWFDVEGKVGDGAHQDYIAIQSVGASTFNITKNHFTTQGIGGQGFIFQTNNAGTVVNFHNNICYLSTGDSNFAIWSGSGTINCFNNIFDAKGVIKGVNVGATVTVNMYNNVIDAFLDSSSTGVVSDYNIWPRAEGHANTIAGEANSLYSQDFSTGFFTDYANQIYAPLTDSAPQVDIGDNGNAPADDFAGVSRPQNVTVDIGPYEAVTGTVEMQKFKFGAFK